MDFIKETLDWANRERAALFSAPPLDELPKGKPCHATCCPIANAFPVDVEVSPQEVFQADTEEVIATLPRAATAFVHAFDRRELPEFEESA